VNRALYRREWKIPYNDISLIPMDALRNSGLFSRSPGLRSRSIFTDSTHSGRSRWITGSVKVGIYKVCQPEAKYLVNNGYFQYHINHLQ